MSPLEATINSSLEPRLLFRGGGLTTTTTDASTTSDDTSHHHHHHPHHRHSSSNNTSSTNTNEPSPFTTTNTNTTISLSRRLQTHYHKLQRRVPCLKRGQEFFLRIPPKIRMGLLIVWCCWKILTVLLILVLVTGNNHGDSDSSSSGRSSTLLLPQQQQQPQRRLDRTPTRILYIVTTLAEFNTGTRSTIAGQDRLGEVLIPILVDSVENMISTTPTVSSDSSTTYNDETFPPLDVDVYLILGYSLSPKREQEIRNRLPAGVGLQIWDDATPLGYYDKQFPTKLTLTTRALARQHRYVIRDKLEHYDVFLCFEDDMRLTRYHVQHFLRMSQELEYLRQHAPIEVVDKKDDLAATNFFGPLTRRQLNRVIPGFIRVEVLVNETEHGAQERFEPIPLDYQWQDYKRQGSGGITTTTTERHVDPTICCHVHMEPNVGTPLTPKPQDLVIWETNIKAFKVREFPSPSSVVDQSSSASLPFLEWAVLMLGPGKHLDPSEMIRGYWSGQEGAFGKDFPQPSGGAPDLLAQQGGWMATQHQLARLNNHNQDEPLCQGSFLPPFDHSVYHGDGQESMNVEFWSGGYQLFTGVKGGCNMQRIISLHPDHVSNHFIYHVANNKQKQLAQNRMVRADHLWGQWNTVRKMAIRAKQRRQP
jgi:hypothetical protein